jgi:hypothetical protein
MIEQALLAALQISLGNSDAISALAMIELCLAQPPSDRSQLELNDLIDDWGRTLVSVDAACVERLKRQLSQICEFSETFPPLVE